MPHTDPIAACDLILRHTPEIPAWPQLPQRDPKERIYLQYVEHLPGATISGDEVHIDTGGSFDTELERLYRDHLDEAVTAYDLGADRAAGLAELKRRLLVAKAPAVKGQVIGPISAALQITDRQRRPILYDELLADAVTKYLRLLASAHERTLSRLAERTIVILDEPLLRAVGSGVFPVSRHQVEKMITEVLTGLGGLRGIHCCDNTDWSLVLSLPIDVVSFDAYNFAQAFTLYSEAVKTFMRRGGIVAWGIVPTTVQAIASATPESLTRRLGDILDSLASKGLDREEVARASLITPSCGLGTLPLARAEQALRLTRTVSEIMKRRYFGQAG